MIPSLYKMKLMLDVNITLQWNFHWKSTGNTCHCIVKAAASPNQTSLWGPAFSPKAHAKLWWYLGSVDYPTGIEFAICAQHAMHQGNGTAAHVKMILKVCAASDKACFNRKATRVWFDQLEVVCPTSPSYGFVHYWWKTRHVYGG